MVSLARSVSSSAHSVTDLAANAATTAAGQRPSVVGNGRRYRAVAVASGLAVLMGIAGASFWVGRASSGASLPVVQDARTESTGTKAERSPPEAADMPAATSRSAKAAAGPCTHCGVVESVQTVQRKGDASGVGAVAGGVVGGVLGNQVGKGDGRTAMTVLGAIGGGFAGNEVEKRAKATTVYRVRVRTDAGEIRTFEQSQPWAVGQSVRIDGTHLHAVQRTASSAP